MRRIKAFDRFRSLRRFAADEGGAAVVLVATSALVLVGAAGLAFDAGRGYMVKARLSQAVDAAALAGGRSLTIGSAGDYTQQIEKYFVANFPNGYMGAENLSWTVALNEPVNDEVTVTASATIPTTLMRVLTVQDMEVSARAVVHRAVKGLEVSMVLDNSGSMSGSKMSSLKTSANLLLDILYGDNDVVDDLSVSIVPFSGRSNLTGTLGLNPLDPPDPDLVCFDPRPDPYHTNDANAVEHAFDYYSGTYAPPDSDYNSRVCPEAAVLPLTESKTTVKGSIAGMEARGGTRYDIGMVWGWRTISPNWDGRWSADPDSPLPYEEANMEKAVIVITDGRNRPDYVGDPISASATENMFSDICASMKAEGIVIYTITFQLNDSGTKTRFRNCASGEARYFDSPNSSELEQAFTIIANDLSTLRLAM